MKIFGKKTQKLVKDAEQEVVEKILDYVGREKKFNMDLSGLSVKLGKLELKLDGKLTATVKKR